MTLSRTTILFPLQADRLLVWTLRVLAGIAGAIVFFILAFLIIETLPVLRHVGLSRFFTDSTWHPGEGLYNLTPMVWGTLFVTVGAVLLATPLGISSSLFCRYYAPPPLGSIYQKVIELLAGIPSVVYGLWGLVILVPFIARLHPPGPSLLAGVAILTVMILPTITLAADSCFSNVPKEYLRGAVALGIGRWAIIRGILMPAAKSGLVTGIVLQTGRAIGETMAILMVCGNVVQTPSNLFDPIRTLTANIALEMAYAIGDHRSALFFSGLLLLLIVFVLAGAAEWINRGRTYGQ